MNLYYIKPIIILVSFGILCFICIYTDLKNEESRKKYMDYDKNHTRQILIYFIISISILCIYLDKKKDEYYTILKKKKCNQFSILYCSIYENFFLGGKTIYKSIGEKNELCRKYEIDDVNRINLSALTNYINIIKENRKKNKDNMDKTMNNSNSKATNESETQRRNQDNILSKIKNLFSIIQISIVRILDIMSSYILIFFYLIKGLIYTVSSILGYVISVVRILFIILVLVLIKIIMTLFATTWFIFFIPAFIMLVALIVMIVFYFLIVPHIEDLHKILMCSSKVTFIKSVCNNPQNKLSTNECYQAKSRNTMLEDERMKLKNGTSKGNNELAPEDFCYNYRF
jgi:hypothetical protein